MNAAMEIATPKFYMHLVNETGDTVITWSEPEDIEVLTFIQKKINEGFVFFIEDRKTVRAFSNTRKITDVCEVEERRVIVADAEAHRLELAGKFQTVKLIIDEREDPPVRQSHSATDIAHSRSYAVRPMFGG